MIFTLTTMKSRIIICLFVVLPTVRAHIFLRVGQEGICHAMNENQVRECARQCIASTNHKQFCYGFTLDFNNVCTPNHELNVPTSESYFVLWDYFISSQCPVKKTVTKEEAEKISKRYFAEPQLQSGDSLFLLGKEHRSIEDCEKFCQERGWTIVSIHSEEENNVVRDFCTANAPQMEYACGLGIRTRMKGPNMNDIHRDVYEDGWNLDGTNLDYKNYAPDEPGNWNGNPEENCVAMYTQAQSGGYHKSWKLGQWNNLACTTKVQCLCRRKIEE